MNLATRHVLVVDDDALTREGMALLLEGIGHRATTTPSGREALDWLRAGGRPHVILLDLDMPVLDGWRFRYVQRQDPDLAAIPVILLSGADYLPEQARALGAAAFFQKPVAWEELLEAMERLC